MNKQKPQIKCVYPNEDLKPMAKKDILSLRYFHHIIKNYCRIKRLETWNRKKKQ
jgi:hypothetical protein